MPRLSLFQSLGDLPNKGKAKLKLQNEEEEKTLKVESRDVIEIKLFLRKRYSLLPKDRIVVTKVEKPIEKEGKVVVIPQFRVNIHLLYDPDVMWKSFWVAKEGNEFIYTPSLKEQNERTATIHP
jgi:hypothetical protein